MIDDAPAKLRIGLVTDLHYAPITVGNRYCSESLTKVTAAAEILKERKPDLMIWHSFLMISMTIIPGR